MIIELDGNELTTKNKFHDYLKHNISLPDYYGNNLDALWDILCSYSEKLHIIIYNKKQLIKNLGDYGNSIIELFEDAVNENNNISFEYK
ncbi:barstar family protein [Mycoplasmatota bacterium]|nr:barstar family protein [Mycoplasmatota bacterium]